MSVTKHPLAGKTLKFKTPFTDHFGNVHTEVKVEDSWINLTGKNWMESAREGNPAAINFSARFLARKGFGSVVENIVYGRTGHYGNLFDISELEVSEVIVANE